MRTWLLLLALVACSKGEKKEVAASGSGSAAPAPTPAPAPADATVTTPDAEAAAPRFFDEKPLGKTEGLILAEKQGGTVEGIADGTKVEIVEVKELMVGEGQFGEVKIKHGGKKLKLKPPRVMIAEAMHYSPDRKHAVFTPMMACGDVCHMELWLVSADGRRTYLGEGTVDYYDAWNGDTLAVSASTLWLVTLADHKVTKYDNYMSPSFSPDGVLYVRTADGSAHTLINGKAKRVYQAPEGAMDNEDEHSVDGPPPVKWKNGKPDFSTDFLPDDMK
jgi:hypothetical protein